MSTENPTQKIHPEGSGDTDTTSLGQYDEKECPTVSVEPVNVGNDSSDRTADLEEAASASVTEAIRAESEESAPEQRATEQSVTEQPAEPAVSTPEASAAPLSLQKDPLPEPPAAQTAAATPPEAKPTKKPARHTPDTTPQPGFAAGCFDGLSAIGPLALIVLWAIQSLPTLMGREICGLNTLGMGVLHTSAPVGLPDPVLFPVYHWFLSGLALIPKLDALLAPLATWLPGIQPTAGLEGFTDYPTALLPLASCLSTLFFVLATWALARATGSSSRTAFASGLVLLTSLAFMGLPRVFGGDMFFAALLTLASLCLYMGWVKTFAPFWLMGGFALVALATLAGGLLGLALPLLTSLLFLVWRGTFRRAGGRDGALAFGLMLVLLLCWGTLLVFTEGGRDQLRILITENYLAPLMDAWSLAGRDSGTLLGLIAVVWLPWTLLIFFLPWEEMGSCLKAIVTNRKQRPGQGWLWCSALIALGVPSLLGADMTYLALPFLAPLAILTAQGLLSLSAGSSRVFFLLVSLVLFVLALLYAAATALPLFVTDIPPLLTALQSSPLPLVPALVQVLGLLVFSLLLGKGTKRSFASGSLLVVTVLALVYTAPLAYFVASNTTQPVPTEAISAPAVPTEPDTTPAMPDSVPSQETAPAPLTATPDQESTPAESTPAPAASSVETTPADIPASDAPAHNAAPAEPAAQALPIPAQPDAPTEKPAEAPVAQ